VEEIGLPGETPADMVVRLAGQKAREVADRVGPNRWVLGVDTLVAIDDHILGKPTDEAHATQMLLQLSDRTHSVYSGFAVVGFGEEETGIDETRVTMRSVSIWWSVGGIGQGWCWWRQRDSAMRLPLLWWGALLWICPLLLPCRPGPLLLS
jgi:hypothetical protein